MAKSGEHAGRLASMADQSFGQMLSDYVTQTLAVAAAEVQKLHHDPLELLTRAVQPVLWLMLFGEVMAQVRGVAPGNIPYLDFLAAGILAQSALFVAIFYGISAIWERDLGVLQRYLVSPAPRSALVLGKALSAGVRGLSQALIVYVLALLLSVNINLDPGEHPGRGRRDRARFGIICDAFADYCVHRKDTRAFHGHRTGADDADFLRQQCHLSAFIDAGLVARDIPDEPFDL